MSIIKNHYRFTKFTFPPKKRIGKTSNFPMWPKYTHFSGLILNKTHNHLKYSSVCCCMCVSVIFFRWCCYSCNLDVIDRLKRSEMQSYRLRILRWIHQTQSYKLRFCSFNFLKSTIIPYVWHLTMWFKHFTKPFDIHWRSSCSHIKH